MQVPPYSKYCCFLIGNYEVIWPRVLPNKQERWARSIPLEKAFTQAAAPL